MNYDPKVIKLPSFESRVPLFLSGEDTPSQYLEQCISMIEQFEPEVQAFVTLNIESAKEAANLSSNRYSEGNPLSPIDGLPIGLKDIIETSDMPTQCGSPIYEGNITGRDAPVTAALRRGGAVIVGKTATTEFAYGNIARTRNPYDLDRTPGSSSSGSAAAVGAGMLPVAIGTQLMSSVMRPASYCGQVGVKPTYGAIRQAAIPPFSPSGEHVGAHTTTLGDAWTVLKYLSNHAGPVPGSYGIVGPELLPPEKKPLRLMRMYTPGWEITDQEVKNNLEIMLDTLSNLDVEIIEPSSDPSLKALEVEFKRVEWCIAEIAAFEMRWPFFEYEKAGHTHHERIDNLLKRAHEITLDEYHNALNFKKHLRDLFNKASDIVDGVIGLTAPEVAPVGLENLGHPVNCSPATCSGVPSLTLPLMTAHNMPLGLQLIGFYGQDSNLFAMANWVNKNLS